MEVFIIMKVQERGTMKWVSLMLPEHVAMLKDTLYEYKEKPILDEQKMVEIDSKLKFASEQQSVLEITYYQTGDVLTLKGKLLKIDQWRGYIVLRGEDGFTISLQDIIDVELVS